MNILVTGASGYIGSLLGPRLIAEGHQVTYLVRNPGKLFMADRDNMTIRQGDLLNPPSLLAAMKDIEVAYYLVHSMADGVQGYIERDLQAARNFGNAAREAGIQRIIYLGGLGECEKSISPHLEARQQVGDILRLSGVPVTELRAAIIIGSGSMSFEMIRYLTERLPIVFTPRWITTLCQPIAIENVLDYLMLSLTEPRSMSATYEIGGPDVLTYEDIMRVYAAARHLKRRLVNVPFLTTWMLAVGAGVVTPLPSPYLHILIEGLRSEVVVNDTSAQEVFNIKLIPYHQAIQDALSRQLNVEAEQYWQGNHAELAHGKTRKIIEGMYIERRSVETGASPGALYCVLSNMGGKHGWFYANGLWKLRGWLDNLAGGPGMGRGRSRESGIQVGDVIDGYTAESVVPGRMIRLRNDMKAPGPAWMQFKVQEGRNGKTLLILTAMFQPHGLAGLAYWYALFPFHQLVFDGMARGIIRQAEAMGEEVSSLAAFEE